MRFEAKKKALSSAVAQVRVLVEALSVASGSKIEALHLVADKKGLHLKSVSGAQVVEATVQEVTVTEPGEAALELGALAKVLSVGGDTFKFSTANKSANFVCGRSKGTLKVLDETIDNTAAAMAPKPTIDLPAFKALLRAVALKVSGKNVDRTLHFNDQDGSVIAESTDQFRGITAITRVYNPDSLPGAAAINLPAKVLDSIAHLLTTGAIVGFDEKFFTLRAPGLYICMPQSSTTPLEVSKQTGKWLAQLDNISTFTFKVDTLGSAIDDAISLGDSNARLFVTLDDGAGAVQTEGDSGRVEAEFDLKLTAGGKTKVMVFPSFLKESLAFFDSDAEVTATVYEKALYLSRVSAEEDIPTVTQQSIIIPLLAPAEPLFERKKTPAAPAPAEQEAETPAPKKVAKKVPAKKVEPETKPETVEEPAAESEEPAEEEVVAPPPAKKPAAKKPPAPAPPPPAEEPAEEDPVDDVEEEESFDEE